MQARFSSDILWEGNIGDVQRDPIAHISSAYRWFLLKWNLSSSISFYLNCREIYVKFINHRSHKCSISSGVDHFPTSQQGAPLTVGSRLHFVIKSISVLGHILRQPFGTLTGTSEWPNADQWSETTLNVIWSINLEYMWIEGSFTWCFYFSKDSLRALDPFFSQNFYIWKYIITEHIHVHLTPIF